MKKCCVAIGVVLFGIGLIIMPRALAAAIPGGGGAIKSSPTAFNGMVYFGNGVGKMLCRPTNGSSGGWTFDTQTSGASTTSVVLSRPALKYIGAVYYLFFTTNDGYVFCLNASNGEKVWSVGPLLDSVTRVDTTPAIAWASALADNVAYVTVFSASEGRVFALRGTDGSTLQSSTNLFVTENEENELSSPAVFSHGVFVGVSGGISAGLRLSTDLSSVLTLLGADLNSGASPFIYSHAGVGNPRVLVTTKTGYLCGYSVSTGVEAFTPVDVSKSELTSPVAWNDRVYMAGAKDGIIYHANTKDGTAPGGGYSDDYIFYHPKPSKEIPGGVTVDPAGIKGMPTVLFGNGQGRFYQVPIDDPFSAIYVQTPGPTTCFTTTPTICPTSSLVLLGNDDGYVYSFPRRP